MVYIGIFVLLFAIEFFIKRYVDKKLIVGKNRSIAKGKIRITKYKNRGAFLNFLDKRPTLVAGISLLFSMVILVYFIITLGKQGSGTLKLGLAILLGGAFSNTYDRLTRTYVVDYFSFQTKSKRLNRVVFNLADFFIMIGAMLVVIAS